MAGLKPCPLCGGDRIVICETIFPGIIDHRFYAQCRNCSARASLWTTKLGAVNAWNRRCDNAKWRNARMETPDGLIEVLACIYYQGVPKIEKVYWSIDHWVLMEGGEVTHWMPLPPFPEEVFMKEESDE